MSRQRERSFPNPFPPYHKSNKETITEYHIKEWQQKMDSYLQAIASHPPSKDDSSVYTGFSGNALLLLRLHATATESARKEQYLRDAWEYVQQALDQTPPVLKRPQREVSLLCGAVGTYAVAAVTFHYRGIESEKKNCLQKLLDFSTIVETDLDSNELLYGRAGYIHALLFAFWHMPAELTLLETAETIALAMVEAGRLYAQNANKGRFKTPSPLMYEWHTSRYLGFAHGLAGIVHTVLMITQLRDRFGTTAATSSDGKQSAKGKWADALKDARASVDYLLSTVFPSGNYPSSEMSGADDRLVQWCHGAPGIALTFCKAYEVFSDKKYLIGAARACDVVWERGLLDKGLGICHGTSGNAYAFLTTFSITKDPDHLYRAVKFSEFAWNDKALLDKLIANPDGPYTLFEGLGGTVYFYNDLLRLARDANSKAEFPSFEVLQPAPDSQ